MRHGFIFPGFEEESVRKVKRKEREKRRKGDTDAMSPSPKPIDYEQANRIPDSNSTTLRSEPGIFRGM